MINVWGEKLGGPMNPKEGEFLCDDPEALKHPERVAVVFHLNPVCKYLNRGKSLRYVCMRCGKNETLDEEVK